MSEKMEHEVKLQDATAQAGEAPAAPADAARKAPPDKRGAAQNEVLPAQKRVAMLRYMAVLFGVAFLLVLLSFLIQMRDSQETISDLSQSQSSALQNAVRLQEENQRLLEENLQLREELEDARELAAAEAAAAETARNEAAETARALDAAETDAAAAQAALEAANVRNAETQLAYDLLLAAKEAAAQEDLEELRSQLSLLAPLMGRLSVDAQEEYSTLEGSLTAEN